MAVNVLVVDDNEADVVLLETAAARAGLGYQVVPIRDGEKALTYLDQVRRQEVARPDLIVLDLNLPCIGGQHLLQEVRNDARLRGIPVVIVSGAPAEHDAGLLEVCPPGSYFVKPGTFREFKTLATSIESYRQSWVPSVD